MGSEKVIEEKKKHSNHHFFPDIKMSHIWEHDTMTQYKAMDLVNDFLSNYYNRKYFAATGFSMTTGLIQCQTNDAKIIGNAYALDLKQILKLYMYIWFQKVVCQ